MSAPVRRPRVAIVDDHAPFRRGLARLLRDHGVDVVAELATAEAALELVASDRPDVVLLDLNLPGMSGVEAALRLTTAPAAPAVVALSVSTAATDLYDALAAGAVGYLVKGAPAEEIAEAVEAAARGDSPVSRAMTRKLVERVREAGRSAPGAPADHGLTERELDVLRLLAEGDDNAAIAVRLEISANTVRTHVVSILAKLGVENRTQAATLAIRRSLV